jgi:glycerol-1-phosphate dehydrogenase [NAD(P)+]
MGALENLLAGRILDPDTKAVLTVPVKSVVIAPSLAGMEADLVDKLDLPDPFAVISDANTYEVLGARVEKALASLGAVKSIRLEGRPHPDDATVVEVMAAGKTAGSYVAVGSGTINDLAKFAAAKQRKRCVVFPTAPSMNGYTSVNAAITVNGHKKSLPAIAPEAVFIDLKVVAKAPVRLIRAGFGDAICRSTAQADWLLAHRLTGAPYRRAPFALFAALEDQMAAASEGLVNGDIEAIDLLVRVLLLSGFGMTIAGSSHPASQGEHLISHLIEMKPPPDWDEPFHGEQIAVTTLTMAHLQDQTLELDDPPELCESRITEDAVKAYFGADVGAACWREVEPKLLDRKRAAALNERLGEIWDDLRNELARVTRPVMDIMHLLEGIGAPANYRDLKLDRAYFADAIRHAREVRNRYTFLDLAGDSGLLTPERLID